MNTIPTPEDVRSKLAALSHAQVQALADKTGVPFTTLWKVRGAETKNPRLDTVRAIWPELIGMDGAPAVPDTAKAA